MIPKISRRQFLVGTAGAASAAVLSACAGATPAAKSAGSADKPTIKLAINTWTGSAVNTHVAKQVLETALGYKVETVDIDENAVWAAMASGDISANLEVWPSGHGENKKKFIEDAKQVVDGGVLGVIGKIGWFTPKYVVDKTPALATWEGFKDPANAAMFKTNETGEAGQFLQGDPAWVYQDENIIKNLRLNLKIVRAGSEQAVLAQLDSAYSRKEPVLFYLWTPHWAFSKYDLVNVKLPAYSADCYAKAEKGGVDCDYPEEILFKAISAKLAASAPEADAMLKKMKYSNQDQIALIADVDQGKMTPADAAKKWVAANEKVWKTWIS
jgi:glycine betaine/proline transport system substrate-binding protein